MVRQRLCEAMYAAGRIKEAAESLLNIINIVDEDIWVSGKLCYPVALLCIEYFGTDFLQRCLSTPETGVDTTLHSLSPTPLLREWAKLKLIGGSWREALAAAVNVSISLVRCSSSS